MAIEAGPALGLTADSTGILKATGDLRQLATAANDAGTAADRLAPKGKRASEEVGKIAPKATTASSGLERLAKSGGQSSSALQRLASMAGGALGKLIALSAAAFSVGGYLKMADAWSDMQSKIGAAVKDMDAAPRLMSRMVDLANASYSPLAQTADVYARNVGILRDLGYNADQAADYTEALNHALVITATRGERAASVQDALSKAMAVGKLQADGLETVMANGGRIAESLAEKLNTNVNGLRAMASEGKITAAVISGALLDSLDRLRSEAGEMPATVADGMTRIATGVQYLIGVFDQTVSASGSLAGALVLIGDGLAAMARWASQSGDTISFVFDTVIGGAVTGATYLLATLAGSAVSFSATWVAAFIAANGVTGSLVIGLTVLKGALIATGFGAIAVAAGVLVGQLLALLRATGSFSEAMSKMFALGKAVFSGLYQVGVGLMHGLAGVANFIYAAFVGAFVGIGKAWDVVANSMVSGWNSIADRGVGKRLGLQAMEYSNVADQLSDASASLYQSAQGQFEASGNAFRSAADGVVGAWNDIRSVVTDANGEVASVTETAPGAGSALADMSSKGAAKASDLQKVMKSLNDELKQLQATAGMTDLQSAIWGKQNDAGVSADSAAGGQIASLMTQIDGLKQLKESADKGRDAMKNLFGSALEGASSFKRALGDLLGEMAKVQFTKGIMSLVGGSSWGSGLAGTIGGLLSPNANGGVYAGAGISAYSGQVVNRPTLFPFAKGTGLMGEAGPEAIMPLKRGRDGKLGVQAAQGSSPNITINNNAPGAVVSTESVTKDEVRIMVSQGIAQNNRNLADQQYLKGNK